jgi:hypothetical protein
MAIIPPEWSGQLDANGNARSENPLACRSACLQKKIIGQCADPRTGVAANTDDCACQSRADERSGIQPADVAVIEAGEHRLTASHSA